MASSKRQTTMAKLNRERRVQEKRELKREKKEAAKAARLAGETFGGEPVEGFGEAAEVADPADEAVSDEPPAVPSD